MNEYTKFKLEKINDQAFNFTVDAPPFFYNKILTQFDHEPSKVEIDLIKSVYFTTCYIWDKDLKVDDGEIEQVELGSSPTFLDDKDENVVLTKFRIVLENQFKTVDITANMEEETLPNIIDDAIIPALLALTYTTDTINKYIENDIL